MEQQNKISAGTIARTAVLLLALVNQMLVMMGRPVIAVADEEITQLITLAFTVAAALVAWWKNNSFTKAARAGDRLMHQLKQEERERRGF